MLFQRIDPDIFTATSLLILSLIQIVCCRPKGSRRGGFGRGGSVAIFGSRNGYFAFTSARWAVLSTSSKILILILCIMLSLFILVSLYRAYIWCTKDVYTGRRPTIYA